MRAARCCRSVPRPGSLVAPDYAVVDGLIEHTAGSKGEAVRLAASSVDRLTRDLAALGGVPLRKPHNVAG